MRITYYQDTDTLSIDLRDEPAAETEDLTDSVLVDYNAQRQIVGITIDEASKLVGLQTVEINDLPNVQVRLRAPVAATTASGAHV